MIILTICTDNPEAEIGLFDNANQVAYETWAAHRELSATILVKVSEILKRNGKTLRDIQGVVGFQGPGSFTGLRIGLTVANTLAYSLQIPIVAAQHQNWRYAGIKRLLSGENDQVILPEYGAAAHVTSPK